MITIIPYKDEWPAEFKILGESLRQGLGDLALRIDHIGSTSVPGLAAKDIIDIQVTAATLDNAIETALSACGYQRLTHITDDHLPPGATNQDDWLKWFFRSTSAKKPVNLHVRMPDQSTLPHPVSRLSANQPHHRTSLRRGKIGVGQISPGRYGCLLRHQKPCLRSNHRERGNLGDLKRVDNGAIRLLRRQH